MIGLGWCCSWLNELTLNTGLKRQVAQQRERILYLEGELRRQEQYARATQLEKKQPGEYVQWDSPEKECSPPQHATSRSRGRSRSPLKPLQLGTSWSQGKWIISFFPTLIRH